MPHNHEEKECSHYKLIRSNRIQGPPGRNGTDGNAGLGSIIAYASGQFVALLSIIQIGQVVEGLAAILAFGNSTGAASFSIPSNSVFTNNILTQSTFNLNGGPVFSFPISRDGILKNISIDFSVAGRFTTGPTGVTPTLGDINIEAGNTLFITGQVFTAPPGSNSFTPVPEAFVTLPLTSPSGVITAGTVISGSSPDLNVILPVGTRVLVVFYSIRRNAQGFLLNAVGIVGYADASLNIL